MKQPSRFFAAALVFVFAALFMAAGASSAPDPNLINNLIDPNVRMSDNFYPPDLGDQLIVADGDASCVTHGGVASPTTIHVQRTTPFNVGGPPNGGGSAFIPGGGWLYGSITWRLDVTIGPQTNPAVASFWPLNDNGAPMNSSGFNTGAIQSVSGSFTIDPANDGVDVIEGTVSGAPNAANWGVCRKFDNEATESPIQGPVVTGNFYMINAGVLTYQVTADPAGIVGQGESGDATAYFMNSLSSYTCPGGGCPGPGPYPGARAGHFRMEFGTTVLGGGVQQTDAGGVVASVTVAPIPNVTVTFSDVTTSGGTNVVQTTDAPPLPGGFQLANGFFYEIFTTASYTSPIRVCVPTGGAPAPQILHFESTPAPGAWVNVPTTVEGNQACGNVNSLSPFAVGTSQRYDVAPLQPVDAYPTLNTMKAGRSVPVKFSLGGYVGLDVFAAEPTSVGNDAACGGREDVVETTTTNASGLTYDAVSGVYTYNWKTSSQWKGQCRTLILKFKDGNGLKANFQFN